MTYVALPEDVRVVAAPLADAPALEIPGGGLLAEVSEAGPWTEDAVRRYIATACDWLAEMTGDEMDRAADWELDLAVPGATRLLNRYAPWVGRIAQQWMPGGGDSAWPDWMGIVMMAAARAAPRVFDGRAVEWAQSYRRRRHTAISKPS